MDVLIKAPVAIALNRAPPPFGSDPNEVEKQVIKARYFNELPADYWTMDHMCPLCHMVLDAYTFAAHAPGCIKERFPRGEFTPLYTPGFNPEKDLN